MLGSTYYHRFTPGLLRPGFNKPGDKMLLIHRKNSPNFVNLGPGAFKLFNSATIAPSNMSSGQAPDSTAEDEEELAQVAATIAADVLAQRGMKWKRCARVWRKVRPRVPGLVMLPCAGRTNIFARCRLAAAQPTLARPRTNAVPNFCAQCCPKLGAA